MFQNMAVWDYQVSEISLRNWKSQYTVKEWKALNFGSHKKILRVNDFQTSTNRCPDKKDNVKTTTTNNASVKENHQQKMSEKKPTML